MNRRMARLLLALALAGSFSGVASAEPLVDRRILTFSQAGSGVVDAGTIGTVNRIWSVRCVNRSGVDVECAIYDANTLGEATVANMMAEVEATDTTGMGYHQFVYPRSIADGLTILVSDETTLTTVEYE